MDRGRASGSEGDRNRELGRREPGVWKTGIGSLKDGNQEWSGSTHKCKEKRESGVKGEGGKHESGGREVGVKGKEVGIGDPRFIPFTSLLPLPSPLHFCVIPLPFPFSPASFPVPVFPTPGGPSLLDARPPVHPLRYIKWRPPDDIVKFQFLRGTYFLIGRILPTGLC